MEVKLTNRGTLIVCKGTTKAEIFCGSDRPYNTPIKISVDGEKPIEIKKKVGLVEVRERIKKLYTEEELLDYLISLYQE